MGKYHTILEKFWLIVAILSTIASTIIGFTDGFSNVKYFFLLSGLAWGMYFVRRGIRKRLQKISSSDATKK